MSTDQPGGRDDQGENSLNFEEHRRKASELILGLLSMYLAI